MYSSQPSWGIGKARREAFETFGKSVSPGPGQYQLTNKDSQKGFTFAARRIEAGSSLAPGPGTYDVKVIKKKMPAFKIGTESRHPIEGTNQMAPGPGSYHFEGSMQVSAPSIKIGTAQRKFIADGIPTPGPGAYDVKRIVAEGPRAVFMRSRSRDHQGLAGPDPGSYTPNIDLVRQRPQTIKQLGSIMSHAARYGDPLNRSAQSPGPGSYDTNTTIMASRGWVIGRGARSYSLNKNLAPGPGAYTLPPMFNDTRKYLSQK